MSTSSLLEIGGKHVTKGLSRLTGESIMMKGQGSYVTMDNGRELLDFTTGIGVTNLGHCHPKVTKAAVDQCSNIVHAQCSLAYHEPYLQLIQRLIPVMPDSSLDSFFFWNSGSEAVEGAMKMAKIFTGRQSIVTMQGGYHGRTFGAMAVTRSKTGYSEGVHPLMPSVFVTPYPYWHQLDLAASTSEEEISKRALYHLDLLLSQQINPKEVAAILIEPLLGEGGYIAAPAAYLRGLRDICDEHGIMLIVDEVQSGFCRTGKFWNIEYSGVRPDILVMAKGLANGFPLSGIISRKELTDKLKPGIMGGTYAGNAVACAAAVAVLDAIQEEKVQENVNARSKELFSYLSKLRQDSEIGKYILDVRGQGLMVSVEFASPNNPRDSFYREKAPKNLASRISKKCLEHGMLILTTSVYEVIRFIPPCNISQGDMAKGCEIFSKAVFEVIHEG